MLLFKCGPLSHEDQKELYFRCKNIMKKREFNKILRSISPWVGKGKNKKRFLDKSMASELDVLTKNKMVQHLIRHNGPILIEFLHDAVDMNNLHANGYMYYYTNNDYTFLGKCNHQIQYGC